jgi:hypothetical protein
MAALAVAAATVCGPASTAFASPPEASDSEIQALRAEDARVPSYFRIVAANVAGLGLRSNLETIERHPSFFGRVIGVREYAIRSGGGNVELLGLTESGGTRFSFDVSSGDEIILRFGGTRIVAQGVPSFVSTIESRPLLKLAALVSFTDVIGKIASDDDTVVPSFTVCCAETDASSDGKAYFCTCFLENCYQKFQQILDCQGIDCVPQTTNNSCTGFCGENEGGIPVDVPCP